MIERPRSKPKSTTSVPARVQPLALFGKPLLLEGEDAAAYDALLAHICETVKPIDTIEEMFVHDIISLQWDVLRWRRIKANLIRAREIEAVQEFLNSALDYSIYADEYRESLQNLLLEFLGEDEIEEVQKLAHQCARGEADAVAKVKPWLYEYGEWSPEDIRDSAKEKKAEKIAQAYAQGEPDALEQVRKHLDAAGRTMSNVAAEVLIEKFDEIERIDRLTATAESRRNASLHEIRWWRSMLGEALRRSVQEVEGEFKVIDRISGKGRSAA